MPPVRRTPTTSSAGRRWRAGSRVTAIAVPRATAAPSPTARCSTSARYADQVTPRLALSQGLLPHGSVQDARAGWSAFDCIEAPCLDECPVDQQVPRYMAAVRSGDFAEAVRITRLDNPLPAILGRVCDHLCENTCIRTHLDQPLAIRQIKRFIMEQERLPGGGAGAAAGRPRPVLRRARVAVIGAGPAGLAAAEWLARAGVAVTIFEEHPYPGGMVGGAIPAYRLPQAQIDQDLAILERLGVTIRYGQRAGVDVTLDGLRAEGFAAIFIAVGAQRAKRLGLPGEDARGVIDGVTFLRSVKEGRPVAIGPRVGVVGAGDTAMDCVRSARRVGASSVSLIYRRTIDQMPADPEEIHAIREEGVEIVELARPVGLRVEDGRLAGLVLPDRVPRHPRPGRRRPQGAARRPGLGVRDRPGHPGPRHQPAPGARLLRRPPAGPHTGRLHRRRSGDHGDVHPGRLRRG